MVKTSSGIIGTEILFTIIAFSPKTGQTVKALLPIIIINVDEHLPYFPHSLLPTSSKLIIYWPDSLNISSNEEFPLGSVEALDDDAEPFNRIEYKILKKCSHLSNLVIGDENSTPLLRVDKQTGEILATGKFPRNNNNYSNINICILASPPKEEETENQQQEEDNYPSESIINIQLLPESSSPEYSKNNLKISKTILLENNSHSILEHKLAKLQKIPINIQINEENNNNEINTKIEINSVLFTPYGKNTTETQRIGSLEPIKSLIAVDSSTAKLRFDPAVLGAFGDGFYKIGLISEENEEGKEGFILYKN
uniref:Cadherin domain-containing protein n=1 Tax=Meloidogyne hapla TaxID=6305 RepID=A0A1I8BTS9_MELHA